MMGWWRGVVLDPTRPCCRPRVMRYQQAAIFAQHRTPLAPTTRAGRE